MLHISPLRARAQDFEDAVHYVPQIMFTLAMVIQYLFYNLPVGIGKLIEFDLYLLLSLVTQK